MGRPQKPLDGLPPRRKALASRLRVIRAAAGTTYAEMANATRPAPGEPPKVSAATFKRAASGVAVPKWPKVVEFLKACNGNEYASRHLPEVHELHDLWVKARMEERGTLHLKKPNPKSVVDEPDLRLALKALYEYNGAPSLREVQKRSGGGALFLPHTTLARIVNRETIPADRYQLLAFLRGCQVPEQHHASWISAWLKAQLHHTRGTESSSDVLEWLERRSHSWASLSLHPGDRIQRQQAWWLAHRRNATKGRAA